MNSIPSRFISKSVVKDLATLYIHFSVARLVCFNDFYLDQIMIKTYYDRNGRRLLKDFNMYRQQMNESA